MKVKGDFKVHANDCLSCGHSLCAKKVGLFANLSEAQLLSVIQLIERTHVAKGAQILAEGDPLERLYIVNRGTLKASHFALDGKEQILYLVHEGDAIGELSLLKVEEAPYHLIALQETFLCTIPKKAFDAFVLENPEIIPSILSAAYDRIRSLEKLVSIISSKDADIRLKFLIGKLIEESGTMTSRGLVVQVPISREDMANFVGVSRETISRKLHALMDQEIIAMASPKQITILKPDYFD